MHETRRQDMTGPLRDTTMTGRAAGSRGWPLFCGLGPLGALSTAPRLARMFTVMVLVGWGLGAVADDAEAVISEMTTNVVDAATGPDGQPRYDAAGRLPVLWLRLLSDGALGQLEVWDDIPREFGAPAERRAGATDESGRGL